MVPASLTRSRLLDQLDEHTFADKEDNTNARFPRKTPTAEHLPTALTSSVRTLMLGLDFEGRTVQHDRNAAKILARKPEDLLGTLLIELTSAGSAGNTHGARQANGAAAVAGLLEAIRSDREGSAILTIDTRDGRTAEAMVTVHPMRAGGTSLAALTLLRIPVPNSERFVDPALMRGQMLHGTGLATHHGPKHKLDTLPTAAKNVTGEWMPRTDPLSDQLSGEMTH